ncbi:hypothetical protein BC629DRAFT_1725803 [Irpex lacteus]|nr:hypothetical protein BC629DRAFT_1725803 [Irpex lacteus]
MAVSLKIDGQTVLVDRPLSSQWLRVTNVNEARADIDLNGNPVDVVEVATHEQLPNLLLPQTLTPRREWCHQATGRRDLCSILPLVAIMAILLDRITQTHLIIALFACSSSKNSVAYTASLPTSKDERSTTEDIPLPSCVAEQTASARESQPPMRYQVKCKDSHLGATACRRKLFRRSKCRGWLTKLKLEVWIHYRASDSALTNTATEYAPRWQRARFKLRRADRFRVTTDPDCEDLAVHALSEGRNKARPLTSFRPSSSFLSTIVNVDDEEGWEEGLGMVSGEEMRAVDAAQYEDYVRATVGHLYPAIDVALSTGILSLLLPCARLRLEPLVSPATLSLAAVLRRYAFFCKFNPFVHPPAYGLSIDSSTRRIREAPALSLVVYQVDVLAHCARASRVCSCSWILFKGFQPSTFSRYSYGRFHASYRATSRHKGTHYGGQLSLMSSLKFVAAENTAVARSDSARMDAARVGQGRHEWQYTVCRFFISSVHLHNAVVIEYRNRCRIPERIDVLQTRMSARSSPAIVQSIAKRTCRGYQSCVSAGDMSIEAVVMPQHVSFEVREIARHMHAAEARAVFVGGTRGPGCSIGPRLHCATAAY